MRFRLHPVLLPLFVFLAVMDGLAAYVIVFLSLLLHEAGHIAAALFSGMRIRSVTIYPYGGELVVPDRDTYPKRSRLLLALGGPGATAAVLAAACAIPFPGADDVIRVQLVILLVNLMPILPLDGGQALLVLFESETSRYFDHTAFLLFSIGFLAVGIALLFTGLPETALLIALAVFLGLQNIGAFRYRRYRRIYDQLKRNRLT
ncbi:stage IV sporulation protein FB [Sporosarcina trichiuri]|uniref:stage IV sporulation protein FB n=1 Tax=Sporosarcina trichiuri TaxID=3056445 RepID=UPI0025B4F938|nr:stage IV sporulation protein FB [Sporosarcina sp. 0.2-SM1T-5]WJY28186.1 stage IV sporulation protein FB [Sporosarcina sp. 0.2-SM1T-5]